MDDAAHTLALDRVNRQFLLEHPAQAADVIDGFGHAAAVQVLAAEARNALVHDAARRAGRVVHEPPHFGFRTPRQEREAAAAGFLGDPRQRDREHPGIERV